ncbi:FimV/HubP family polar landmark protein [Sulfurirhabdus autotrophica]|uniref:Pilus assembly protein FimV n=1 Tax=Sulfurirhabdus autotrophica TaxID=1706046 RepID=A0A4R3YE98_9PROT|nr:FimV/HubP family polar landmark protein [Sulfurirhabdus autotrophica]TCV90477.1 pilus assembly protein FimV [Sulfurirhabdus autotrophica]
MQKYIIRKSLIAAGLLLLPLSANAAGLGKLTVTSALGQPLRAEAVVMADQKEDVASFVAKLASQEAYRDAKLERASVLSSLKFSVERKPGGQVYLRITSTAPVNDPFLDMLIELNWSSGRLLREYSVLLDPPGFGEGQSVSPVAVPLVKAISTEAPIAKPKSDMSEGAAPATKPVNAAKSSKMTPAERTFPKQKAAKTEDSGVSQTASPQEAENYAVKKGDTLSKIAGNLKSEGVNLDQMLVGLYQNNKQAFAGNMNRLKTGQILRVPEAEKLAAIDKSEAAKEVKVHSADWNSYRQKLAAVVAGSEVEKEKAPTQTVTGKIASAEDKAAAKPEPSKDVLKLSKGEVVAGKGAAAGKNEKGLQDRIHSLEEEATAKEKTIKESSSRISELEKNIKEMQKLLDVKSQNLADLQKQAAATKERPAAVPPVTKPAEEVKPAPVVEAKPAAEPAPVVAEKPAVEAKPVEATKLEPEKKPEPEKITPVEQAKPAEPVKPAASWYDEIIDNPLYLAGGAGAVLLAGLAGLFVAGSRRKKKLTSFEDSIMTGGDLKPNTVLGNTGGGVIDTGDTSFLTDFSQAGLGTIDTNDVDPIAEAEVYMAYGRDAQAEEILNEAMSKDPNRHEIQLKLLEIYASRKNAQAYETLASELYAAQSGKPGAVWEKAAEMGRELDPKNPLYAAGFASSEAHGESSKEDSGLVKAGMVAAAVAGTAGAVAEMSDMVDDTTPDLDFSLDADTNMVVEPEEAPLFESESENEDEGILNFDMELPGSDVEAETGIADALEESPLDVEEQPQADAPVLEDFGLDFDMDTIIPQALEKKQAAAQEEQEAELNSNEDAFELGSNLDLELPSESDIGLAPVSEEEAISLEAPSDDSDLDFDFNLDEESPEPAESTQVQQSESLGLDLSGITLDMDESPTIAAPNVESKVESGDHWQEVSTKLDLAKAYVEMGDAEGAREILQEVVSEGDQQQQDDAKSLLAELG